MTYCVYVPANFAGERRQAAKIMFVPDCFSRGAFFFGPIWCLRRRAWFALLVWLFLSLSIWILTSWLALSTMSAVGVSLISFAAFAFEANSLLGYSLNRRDFKLISLVVASCLDQAELRFFGRQAANLSISAEKPDVPKLGFDLDPIVHQFGLFSRRGG